MALHAAAAPDDNELSEARPGDRHHASPEHATDSPATSRGGRLVKRWVPDSLRDARWEPGRPGALALLLVAALAAVVAAVGVWWERPVPEPAPSLPLITAAAGPAPSATPPPAAPEVVVSVAGRVARPGLIRLPDGTRVADALTAAGGALPGTDLMGLNIARRLSDGEQLLVGVAPPPGQPVDGAAPGAPSGTSQKVDLNTATLEQLDVLPGVGPVTAQRILDWRATHGRFTSVSQLREVTGIGPARLARLKDLVRV
jgi:competence protein ComEA